VHRYWDCCSGFYSVSASKPLWWCLQRYHCSGFYRSGTTEATRTPPY